MKGDTNAKHDTQAPAAHGQGARPSTPGIAGSSPVRAFFS